jgi:hypothetical protein
MTAAHAPARKSAAGAWARQKNQNEELNIGPTKPMSVAQLGHAALIRPIVHEVRPMRRDTAERAVARCLLANQKKHDFERPNALLQMLTAEIGP